MQSCGLQLATSYQTQNVPCCVPTPSKCLTLPPPLLLRLLPLLLVLLLLLLLLLYSNRLNVDDVLSMDGVAAMVNGGKLNEMRSPRLSMAPNVRPAEFCCCCCAAFNIIIESMLGDDRSEELESLLPAAENIICCWCDECCWLCCWCIVADECCSPFVVAITPFLGFRRGRYLQELEVISHGSEIYNND